MNRMPNDDERARGAFYESRDKDGKAVFKTFEELNADLLASSEEQKDPTKPGFLKYMLCGSVMGGAVLEAKERSPTHAFLHIVSWNEFKPYLDELADGEQKEVDKKRKEADDADARHDKKAASKIRQSISYMEKDVVELRELKTAEQFYDDGSMIDLSWDNGGIAQVNPLTADILHRILIARKADLRRGDAVRMQFVGYRCYGVYFFDGVKVILPEEENSDYYHVPSVFKVPTEFPLNYWDECTFTGYSHVGDVCFDVASITAITPILPISTPKYDNGDYTAYTIECTFGRWYLVVIHSGDDEEDKIAKFRSSGLCWDVNRLEHELGVTDIVGIDPKRVVVI